MINTSKDKAASSRSKVKAYKPSPAQCAAGNYPKLFLSPQKLKITVENPAGSYREGVSPDGSKWRNYMPYDYGFVASGAIGADGDKVDIFLGPKAYYSPVVHIIDQVNPDGSFDEHKCMLGWDTQAEARKAYLAAYEPGWKGCGDITTVSIKAFKKWVKSGATEPLSPVVKKAMATTKSKEELKELLFHGSPERRKVLKPMNNHGDPGVGDVVFATPHEQMALAYLGNSWGDRDINQGSINGKWALTEMRPGALDEIYPKDKVGYMHEVAADSFKGSGKTLDGDFERTSDTEVTPETIRKIVNIQQALKDSGVTLAKFDPKGHAYKAATKRMLERLVEMNAKEREQYLDWVGETNPKLQKELLSKVK